jgi:glycosyltransferase involved in cell wall biosynthesis
MFLPRISIVIPSFNQSRYLGQAIESVLNQDYPNLELVIIDGGSQDGSLDIIQQYSGNLAYWVSEADGGQSQAINKGFAKTTGDIVTFLSSDDTYLPGTLLDVGKRFESGNNYGLISGSFLIQNEMSEITKEKIMPCLPHPGPIDLTIIHPGKYRIHQVSTFYSRKSLEDVGFYVREDLKYVMDRELLYRVCKRYSALLVERAYGVFRKHDLSKSENSILPFAKEFSDLYLESRTGDRKEDKQRVKNARTHQVHGWIKYAKASRSQRAAIGSLLHVIRMEPSYIFRYVYLNAWKKVILNPAGRNNN